MRKRSFGLKGKLLLPVIGIFAVSIVIILLIVLRISSSNTTDLSDKLMTELNQHYASIVQGKLNAAMEGATVLEPFFEQNAINKAGNRENDISMLTKVLENNTDAFGLYTLWEPNAYDGHDSDYIGKPGNDDTGRFIPYVYRGDSGIVVDPLLDYTIPGTGDYYLVPKNTGKSVTLDPYLYTTSGKQIYISSMVVPIMIDGKFQGIIGVDVLVDTLINSIKGVKLFDSGYIVMADSSGNMFYNPNNDLVGKSIYDYLGKTEADEVKSALGSGNKATFDTISKFSDAKSRFVISPVSVGGKNWSVVSIVPVSEITKDTTSTIFVGTVTGCVSIVVIFVLIFFIVSTIIKPIRKLTEATEAIEAGNIDKNVTDKLLSIKTNDEIGTLAHSMQKAVSAIERLSKDTRSLGSAANDNDLSIEIDTLLHKGIYKDIMEMVTGLFGKLSTTVSVVSIISEQVTSGATLVSNGAQALAQGATEQASAVQQLTASLEEIASQTSVNAQNADMANDLARDAKTNANSGNTQMKEMLRAMDGINESSVKISKIIKVIDDIAFQTNILALNAAVEAARAGQNGKGFAVVAEEVRTLAGRSANAAKEITDMIEGSMSKVNAGTIIANGTDKALGQIVSQVEKAADLVSAIAVASKNQAAGIEQINLGIIQVSQVVQNNAATAEESAAASEELSAQAAQLDANVNIFKLKDQGSSGMSNTAMLQKNNRQPTIQAGNPVNNRAALNAPKPRISMNDNDFGKY